MTHKRKREERLLFFITIVFVVGLFHPIPAQAAVTDNPVTFYNTYKDGVIFNNGNFYFGSSGTAASSATNTTHYGTIGIRMHVVTATKSGYIYFSENSGMIDKTDDIIKNNVVYALNSIKIDDVKIQLRKKSTSLYNEFIRNGGTITIDSCMVTIKIDSYGHGTKSGTMDDNGNFTGRVYTDYAGIAGAAYWGNPYALHSYFNKTVNYTTTLMLPQKVQVRYQKANGAYGAYQTVINKSYVYGETVTWSRKEDACYNKARISYTATQGKTSYLSVSRKKYTITASAGTGISSATGSGSYYYGANCTVDAAVSTGYKWKCWDGTYTSSAKKYTFEVTKAVALIANTEANSYSVLFYPNGGSGTMPPLTCKYNQTYTLPAMSFKSPSDPCTYVGWHTDASALKKSYDEGQKIKNLASVDKAIVCLYAIWDYAPNLTCSDRYFTLYEAQKGVITEDELLRTVKAEDREDQDQTIKIEVKNYLASEFTSFTESGELTITYTATDSIKNITKKQAKITIVDTQATQEGPIDFDGVKKYARHISPTYYMKSYEEGGLEATSIWRTDPDYKNTLEKAMRNVKGEDGEWSHVESSYTFTQEDIKKVKQYVTDNGMGNSKDETALSRFVKIFMD